MEIIYKDNETNDMTVTRVRLCVFFYCIVFPFCLNLLPQNLEYFIDILYDIGYFFLDIIPTYP
jgi:hypothetical protein